MEGAISISVTSVWRLEAKEGEGILCVMGLEREGVLMEICLDYIFLSLSCYSCRGQPIESRTAEIVLCSTRVTLQVTACVDFTQVGSLCLSLRHFHVWNDVRGEDMRLLLCTLFHAVLFDFQHVLGYSNIYVCVCIDASYTIYIYCNTTPWVEDVWF